MEKESIKIFISDPSDCLGQAVSLSLKKEGYEMVDRSDIESNIIIHNAEKTEFNLSKKEKNNAFDKTNVEGTRNLCTAIDRWSVKPSAFIYISSVAVYGSKGGELITENHPLNGSTPYAESKIMAEDLLIEWAYKHKVCLCILRLPQIVACKNSTKSLGKMIKTIRSGKYLSIGNRKSRKSAVWAEDIATLIPKIPAIEGIYNLTDDYHPTYRELETLIAKSLNKKPPFNIPKLIAIPFAWIGDLLGTESTLNSKKLKEINTTLTFDDQKARKTFGWKPSNVLEKLAKVL